MMCHPATAICLLLAAGAPAVDAADAGDSAIAAARRYVEGSDRYLHHSRLERGMTGYGLTVMRGTELGRFDVEIVSVMDDWGPHQDVILARVSGTCGGVDLSESGLVSGMSGSPVFIRDPRDGKEKIIGAVAYGWTAQKRPQCGVQPITQMLASAGVGGGDEDAAPDGGAWTGAAGRDPEAYVAALLDPSKRDFAAWLSAQAAGRAGARRAEPGRLMPLQTPLVLSGMPHRAMRAARELLSPLGLVPLAGGGLGQADRAAVGDVRLEPGAAMAVPMVTGDADWVAIGTVTDVVEGRVLGFGHAFQAEGDVDLPMGSGYVHTVVSSLLGSFKLGSTVRIDGTVQRDQAVGVSGRLGPKPSLVPMRIAVEWTRTGRKQVYTFNIARHRLLTVALARMLLQAAAWGWHGLPPEHTVRYAVEIRFADLPVYRVENVAGGENVTELISDVSRPLAAMLDNPLGPPAELERIDVRMTIQPTNRRASLLALRLDGRTYRPGETVTGKLLLRPFRAPRTTMPVRFALPDDMPEGEYTLEAMDYLRAVAARQAQRPHRYAPETPRELFDAVRRVVATRATHVYLRAALPTGGLALDRRELPLLPPSKARVIAQARREDTHLFGRSVTHTLETSYDISGSVSASFRVRKRPAETRLRLAEDPGS